MSEFYPTREVNTSFWETSKEYSMTLWDRVIYLYALTNKFSCKPFYTNVVCEYEVRYKFDLLYASLELGTSEEQIIAVLERLRDEIGVIEFNNDTNEIVVYPM